MFFIKENSENKLLHAEILHYQEIIELQKKYIDRFDIELPETFEELNPQNFDNEERGAIII